MRFVVLVLALLVCLGAADTVASAQILWSSPAGSDWLTGSNWNGGTAPSATDIAQFSVNPTSGTTGVGIDMSGSTNNGPSNQAVGAIEVTSGRSANLLLGNSSASANGLLTLNGTTVNTVSNVILYNNSGNLLTIQDVQGSGTMTMGLVLGNATTNVIHINSSGGITISSVISGSGKNLTKSGSGTGMLQLRGLNTYTGTTTVLAGTLQLNRTGGGTLPSTNNVVISGGTLKISSDQTLNNLELASAGTLTLDAGVTLTINGTFTHKGGTITGAGTIVYGASGTLEYAGTTAYTTTNAEFPASNGPANLTINNAGGVTLHAPRTITGTLTLTKGIFHNIVNQISLGNGATISRANGTFATAPSFGYPVNLIYAGTTPITNGYEKPSADSSLNNMTVTNTGGLSLDRSFVINGNLTIGAGGILNAGNAVHKVRGNFSNSGTFNAQTSTILMQGTSPQTINGTTTFYSLTIDNAAGVSLLANVTVSSFVSFVNGMLNLGAYNLTVNGGIGLNGGPPTSYPVTNGSGYLIQTVPESTWVFFPIGASRTTSNDCPDSTSFNGVWLYSVADTSAYKVRVKEGWDNTPANTNNTVNRQWTLEGNGNVMARFIWNNNALVDCGDVAVPFTGMAAIAQFNPNTNLYNPYIAYWSLEYGGPLTSAGSASPIPTFFETSARFIAGRDGASLPIQLAAFSGTFINNTVRLNWRTISEINNYGFYIQKRTGSTSQWLEIPNSFVPGHGTTNEPQNYSFVDQAPGTGSLQYRLKQVDLDGSIHYTEPIMVNTLTSVNEQAPLEFILKQNYPNPFNPSTEIKFSVAATDKATLEVYNMLGQKVATLFDGIAEAGQYYKVRFEGSSLASGMYLYKLQSGRQIEIRKLMLVK